MSSEKTTLALVLAIWAAVGPLAGVVLGGYLSWWVQRKRWIIDNKKQEYRELLTALTRAFDGFVLLRAPMVALGPEEQRRYNELEVVAAATIQDRLFIAKELDEIELLQRWSKAAHDFDHTHDLDTFAKDFRKIRRSITDAANRIIT